MGPIFSVAFLPLKSQRVLILGKDYLGIPRCHLGEASALSSSPLSAQVKMSDGAIRIGSITNDLLSVHGSNKSVFVNGHEKDS